jgi:hypothetical protein
MPVTSAYSHRHFHPHFTATCEVNAAIGSSNRRRLNHIAPHNAHNPSRSLCLCAAQSSAHLFTAIFHLKNPIDAHLRVHLRSCFNSRQIKRRATARCSPSAEAFARRHRTGLCRRNRTSPRGWGYGRPIPRIHPLPADRASLNRSREDRAFGRRYTSRSRRIGQAKRAP